MSCTCPITLGNTGRPGCVALLDITKYAFLMNLINSDGVRNGIEVGDEVNNAYITAKINEPDPTKRWYPTLKLSGVTDERPEPTTEDIDGIAYITGESPRRFTAMCPQASQVYMSKLKSGQCGQLAIFNVDDSNRLTGSVSYDETGLIEMFYPHIIEEGTFYVGLTKPTVGAVQKVTISFNYSMLEKDENIDVYQTTANIATLASKGGLIDVQAEISAKNATSFKALLTNQYGTANNPSLVKGLVLADFALQNLTTGLPVVLTGAGETTDGLYTFVFAAQTLGNTLRLTDTKDGLELNHTFTL